MPPVNQQRSATGLIVALVVFVILFVTSAIFAMNYYNKLKVSDQALLEYQKNYTAIVPESSINSATVSDLKAARQIGGNGITATDSVVDVAVKQRDTLIALVMGAAGTNSAAQASELTTSTLKAAAAKTEAAKIAVKIDPASPNLLLTVSALADSAKSQSDTIAGLQKQLAEETTKHQQDLALSKDATEKYAADIKSQADRDASTIAGINSSLNNNKETVQKTTDDVAKITKDQADATAKAQADGELAKRTIAARDLEIATLKAKLAYRRMDPSQSVLTQVDGRIIRAAGKDVCYINLGRGMQISPGLTFEVYERTEGVPAIPPNTSGDDHLPIGKASIEVTRVNDNDSECRVVHLEPGAVLTEGDLIANLVYDPNVKFKFFVYGNFDMSQSGRPNAADGDVIRRLITQWGSTLTEKIDQNTDFVVLGAEPQLPTYTKDEMQDPLNASRMEKAQAELDKYANLRQTAIDYHIPIMNQNRFLYYVGFYDQSKR